MNKFSRQLLGGLALACVAMASPAALSMLPTSKPAETAAKPKAATVKGAMASVSDIALQLRVIDKRLQSIEQSVAGIDASLTPLGVLTRPEGLRAFISEVVDAAYTQARSLIFLATGCAAGLIVLFAVLRRWSNPPRAGRD